MPELGEAVSFARLEDPFGECPFSAPICPQVPNYESEMIASDDRTDPQLDFEVEENNSSALGDNLKSGSGGAPDAVNDYLGSGPPELAPCPRHDTRTTGETVLLRGHALPYTVAAHHLIPGRASLEESTLIHFMKKDSTVQDITGRTLVVRAHIGYNMNGSHNGAWLPGNYAVRGRGGFRATWSVLVNSDFDWCKDYMIATVKETTSQFHDTHVLYNNNVQKLLDKIATQLWLHLSSCEQCQKKSNEIPPPYSIKTRLYRISKYLKSKVTGHPVAWRWSWYTSDRFKWYLENNRNEFMKLLGS